MNIPKEKFREVLSEPGSYLFRFSSKGTGVYTLSAMNDSREIGNYRNN